MLLQADTLYSNNFDGLAGPELGLGWAGWARPWLGLGWAGLSWTGCARPEGASAGWGLAGPGVGWLRLSIWKAVRSYLEIKDWLAGAGWAIAWAAWAATARMSQASIL